MNIDSNPQIIYKYRSWNSKFHKRILTHGEVYLSSPQFFNDPFDFGVVQNFLSLNTQEKIEKYVDQGLYKYKTFLLNQGIDLDKEREFQIERLQNLEEYQLQYEVQNSEAINKNYGILSLSGRWDSILMWSHYGDFHKGFNIGYNESKMRKSGLFGKGGKVIYSDEYPHLDPFIERTFESTFLQTHYKSKDWKYEEEYRLTKLFFPNPATEKDRTVIIPFDFVDEINLGINISTVDKLEIIKIAQEMNINVFQTKKIPFKFKLTRNQI